MWKVLSKSTITVEIPGFANLKYHVAQITFKWQTEEELVLNGNFFACLYERTKCVWNGNSPDCHLVIFNVYRDF